METVPRCEGEKRQPPLFMPHWRTDRETGEHWRRACVAAGVTYCSPIGDPAEILSLVRPASVVVTEALHGAVVAEACGIPWVPIVVSPNVLAFKWQDWCASIGIEWNPVMDLPTLRAAPLGWGDRLKVLSHRIGLGKEKYRFLRGERDLDSAIDAAAGRLVGLAHRSEARHHRGVARVRNAERDRLLSAFERFHRDVALRGTGGGLRRSERRAEKNAPPPFTHLPEAEENA